MAILLGRDHRKCSKRSLSSAASSGQAAHDERIHGYTKVGIEKYHIQHLRDLVAPDFAESKLGKYLLNTFVERDPWLSGESIGQIFRARGGLDMTPRLATMKVPTLVINGEYDNSLEGARKPVVDSGGAQSFPSGPPAIEDPASFDEFIIDFLRANHLMPAVAALKHQHGTIRNSAVETYSADQNVT